MTRYIMQYVSADAIAILTLAFTFIGVVIAAAGVLYAIKTLKDNGRIARAQFFATLRSQMDDYRDVHVKLRPKGDWAVPKGQTYAHKGPVSNEEWTRVELYMGLFEYCEVLLDRGLMEQEDFNRSFKYRLENLMGNAVIVEAKLLGPLRAFWTDFVNLCKRCEIPIPLRGDIDADRCSQWRRS